MKKIIVLLAVLALIVSCGAQKKDSYLIGISKIVAHPALDATEKGIQDQLAKAGLKCTFDLQNANGDPNAAKTIASKFKAEGVDVAVGIATPTAQALVATLDTIPVVFSAVTDPVAAGLVAGLDKGGKNVTGVSDMTPVKAQIQFLMKIKPIKTLGHVYTSSEKNAQVLADIAKKACEELGIGFVSTTVSNSGEVKQATQMIAGKVDAIYVSTDNTVVSALSALVEVATDKGIPVMSADPSSAEKIGVLAAWGFDYYKVGTVTGAMIVDILNGQKAGDIPTRFMTEAADVDLLINLDVAKKLKLTFPEDIIKTANKVVENGKLTTK
jgi:putative ABC transport system substrate-binding protein